MVSGRTQTRVIVITGGGAGIGKAVALMCAARGDKIAILDRDAENAKRAAEEAIAHKAPDALGLECDVTSEEQIERAFAYVSAHLGSPYGLFANAATGIRGFIHELPLASWRQVIDTNLTGVFLSCKHALRSMVESKTAGSIVCTSSPTGFVALGAGGAGAYSASKGAISALVRCMAVDYARYGIRVNAAVPASPKQR